MIPAMTETATANARTFQLTEMSLESWKAVRNKAQQEIFRGEENGESGDATKEKEQQAFREKLTDEARALRARAWRTAISRPRPLALASRRLATLTQLMSRTSPTAPKSITRVWRVLPTMAFAEGSQANCPLDLRRVVRLEIASSVIRQARRAAIWAAAIEKPGLSRAVTRRVCTRKLRCGAGNGSPERPAANHVSVFALLTVGAHIAIAARHDPDNAIWVVSRSRSVLPRMWGSAANSRLQRPSLSTTSRL